VRCGLRWVRPLEEEVDEVVDELGEGGWELAEFFDRGVLDGHCYASQDEVLEDIWIKYSTDNLLDLLAERWSTNDYRPLSYGGANSFGEVIEYGLGVGGG
jgi:hypothetical protein